MHQKLVMDFLGKSSLGPRMDENRDELIALLGTRIGMTMEDVVDIALTVGSANPDRQEEQIKAIVEAAGKISKLAHALDSLVE